MEPSALPAFSPPSGVRSWPRRAASCGLTPPSADCVNSRAAANPTTIFISAPFICSRETRRAARRSERKLDAGGDEVAIAQHVVLAGAAVVGVGDIQLQSLADPRCDPHCARVTTGKESAAGPGDTPLTSWLQVRCGVRLQSPIALSYSR